MAIHRTPIKTNAGNTSISMYFEYCRGCDKSLTDGVETYSCTKCTQKYHKQCVNESMVDKQKKMFVCNNCCKYKTRQRALSCDDRKLASNENATTGFNMKQIEETDEMENVDVVIEETVAETGNDTMGTEKNNNSDEKEENIKLIEEEAQREMDEELLKIQYEFVAQRLKTIKRIGKKGIEGEMKKSQIEQTEIAIDRMEMLKSYCIDGMQKMQYGELLTENVTLRLIIMQLNNANRSVHSDGSDEKRTQTVKTLDEQINNANLSLDDNESTTDEQRAQTVKTFEDDKHNEQLNEGLNLAKRNEEKEKNETNDGATKDNKVNMQNETANDYKYEVFCRYDKQLNHIQLRQLYSQFGRVNVKVKNVPSNKYALIKFDRFENALSVVQEGTTKNEMNVIINCNWSNFSRKLLKLETTSNDKINWRGRRNDLEYNERNNRRYNYENGQRNDVHSSYMRINPFGSMGKNVLSGKQARRQNDVIAGDLKTKQGTHHDYESGYEVKVTTENTNMNQNEIKWAITSALGEILNKQNSLTVTRVDNKLVCIIKNMKMEPNYLAAKLNLCVMPCQWKYEINIRSWREVKNERKEQHETGGHFFRKQG